MPTMKELEFLYHLVALYSDALEQYCLRCLASIPDRYQTTQDIVQSTYLDALESVSTLMKHPNVLGWLKRVCYYHIADELKSRKKHPQIVLPNDQVECKITQNQLVEGLWLWEQTELTDVIDAVGSILTQEEQAVFQSVFLDGYTMKETAQQKNMKFDVVRSKVNAIRRKLHKFFNMMCIFILLIRYIV